LRWVDSPANKLIKLPKGRVVSESITNRKKPVVRIRNRYSGSEQVDGAYAATQTHACHWHVWYTQLGRDVGVKREKEAVALISLITLRYQSHCHWQSSRYRIQTTVQGTRLIMESCCGDYLFGRSSMRFAAVNVFPHIKRTEFNADGQETSLTRDEIVAGSEREQPWSHLSTMRGNGRNGCNMYALRFRTRVCRPKASLSMAKVRYPLNRGWMCWV
jgi:hypothetical protein